MDAKYLAQDGDPVREHIWGSPVQPWALDDPFKWPSEEQVSRQVGKPSPCSARMLLRVGPGWVLKMIKFLVLSSFLIHTLYFLCRDH